MVAEVADFTAFWRAVRAEVDASPTVAEVSEERTSGTHTVHFIRWTQGDGITIGGWLLTPAFAAPTCAVIVGHGYAGRSGADRGVLPAGAIGLFPCMPGFARSAHPEIPDQADAHVLHGIADRRTYVLRACVEAIWRSADYLAHRYPGVGIGFLGESFSGGLGALALPWEPRIQAAVLVVPTFGNHPLRLQTPCSGSGEAVRRYHAQHPEVVDVLAYYDAAVAARHIRCPVLVAPAAQDPAVPPGGQAAVAKAIPGAVIHPLTTGHPTEPSEAIGLVRAWRTFFATRLSAGPTAPGPAAP